MDLCAYDSRSAHDRRSAKPLEFSVRRTRGDKLWHILRREAHDAIEQDVAMATFLTTTVLIHTSLERAVAHRVASRVADRTIFSSLVVDAFEAAFDADPRIVSACRRDLVCCINQDPGTGRVIEPLLYFKGFHAIQLYRLSHWLWTHGKQDFALHLQSRSSEVFQADIHPAAAIGERCFLGFSTGIVVGETAVIEDDVSIFQGVTLGGNGTVAGKRHPTIRSNVILEPGVTVLGDIEIGSNSTVVAGSLVMSSMPPNSVVAGVPATAATVSMDQRGRRLGGIGN
jgi:serine O-acetyltransferase